MVASYIQRQPLASFSRRLRVIMEGGGTPMPDNPELDRYWAGQIDQKLKGLADQFERERNERIAQFTENRKERRQYNEGVRNVIDAQIEAVRTLMAKVEQVLPEVRSHAEQIDELVPTITKSKERLDEWEPHVKHYAT
jgi:hypothetical protein